VISSHRPYNELNLVSFFTFISFTGHSCNASYWLLPQLFGRLFVLTKHFNFFDKLRSICHRMASTIKKNSRYCAKVIEFDKFL